MSKNRKIVKISEEIMDEIINADRSFIQGNKSDFPKGIVRTTSYEHKDDGEVWTTDQQQKAAAQPPYYAQRKGYSTGGGLRETYLIEDDVTEDIYKRSSDSDLIKGKNLSDSDLIKGNGFEDLYGYYNATDLAEKTKDFLKSLDTFSQGENSEGILYSVLKEILSAVNTEAIPEEQKNELKDYI